MSSPSTPLTYTDQWWVWSAFALEGRLLTSNGFAMLPKTNRILQSVRGLQRVCERHIRHTKWSVDGNALDARRFSMSIVRHVAMRLENKTETQGP